MSLIFYFPIVYILLTLFVMYRYRNFNSAKLELPIVHTTEAPSEIPNTSTAANFRETSFTKSSSEKKNSTCGMTKSSTNDNASHDGTRTLGWNVDGGTTFAPASSARAGASDPFFESYAPSAPVFEDTEANPDP